ncbi:peptidylprolyl isomerase [Extensimonas vulgaris]|uniref:Chaperone SurA n=1 Tax=Extensimonas vulgaris TaxID=1031594 RepID=A0A369AGS5_9BURK|nr:peptidylprolyl isomerase [Extensimonas vulgaris]RCX07558.1 periplasmic chaperone for outer membrane proteins SurA [Extensimonas vulgaris]TWI41448.1 periplasmic chaperone for outer membrane proteins SurA [Extensimonas vulgaris]TXD12922.1 molecular chaperone SurA [Extensimonas vulgaris]
MNHRFLALLLTCLACLCGLALQNAAAQGLRPAAGAGKGLTRPAPQTPASTSISTPAFSANPSQTQQQADYIVALVNSEPITNNEVRNRMARIERQIAQQGAAAPPREVLAREVLEQLILEKVQLQEAKETGIRVDDYAVDQAERNVAHQNQLSVEDFYRRLAEQGISRKSFREELRNQLLLQRLRDREVQSRVRVTDLDVDQYLQQQRSENAAAKAEVNLAHFFVPVPENAAPAEVAQRQARAQAAADRLRAGEDFATVARELADAQLGAAGTLMGLRPLERYPELFANAVATLPVGAIAGPLRSGAGFHVLKVVERNNAGIPAVITQSHVRHILLRTGPQLSETAAAARLAELRRRMLAGTADFADLAREYSQDGSAKQGGDLGWVNPGRFVPEFEEAMNALKPGEISEPVVTRFGVHLIQVLERREVKPSQRELRDMARDTVREQKAEQAYTTWLQELRGRAYIEYRDPPQ